MLRQITYLSHRQHGCPIAGYVSSNTASTLNSSSLKHTHTSEDASPGHTPEPQAVRRPIAGYINSNYSFNAQFNTPQAHPRIGTMLRQVPYLSHRQQQAVRWPNCGLCLTQRVSDVQNNKPQAHPRTGGCFTRPHT